MTPIVNPGIEHYAARHSSPEPALFKQLARATWAQTGLPQMQVGHLEGSFLRLLMRIARAKRVLEIGTGQKSSRPEDRAAARPRGGHHPSVDRIV